MARVHVVGKTRQERTCGKCGRTIEVGQSYRWAAPRSSKAFSAPKKIRCSRIECRFRASDLTASAYRQELYGAVEAFEDGFDGTASWEDIASDLRSMAEEVRGVAEQMRESVQNMEDGFGHETYQSQELGERADAVEEWADAIEEAADDDPDRECGECGLSEEDGPHHEYEAPTDGREDDGAQCQAEDCETEKEEHHEYQADEVDMPDVVGECPE